jgi:hypothetical protein
MLFQLYEWALCIDTKDPVLTLHLISSLLMLKYTSKTSNCNDSPAVNEPYV